MVPEEGGHKLGYWISKRMIDYVNEGVWAASPLKIPGTQDRTQQEAAAWVEVNDTHFESY